MEKYQKERYAGAAHTNRIRLSIPENGKTVDVSNPEVSAFSKSYEEGISAIIPFKENRYAPLPVRFEWTGPAGTEKFVLALSDNPKFIGGITYTVKRKRFSVRIPFRSVTVYWKVYGVIKGRLYVSETFCFFLKSIPSEVFLNGVYNTRDIGGYKATTGKTVKMGTVYRGGDLDGITDAGKRVAKNVLKIRAVLDLRRANEGNASKKFSSLGREIKRVNECGCMYTGYHRNGGVIAGKDGIDTPEGAGKLVRELLFFADKNNFPAYVHCVLGRDRTGTLIIFLLGICGVEKRDITYDYELSFLSEKGRDADTDVKKILNYAENVFAYVDSFSGDTLKDKMTDLLLKAGMKKTQIAKIRKNLLA